MSAGPTQAIILAAGLGSRLRPITDTTPKPLVPFFGRPLLDWSVRAARLAGVRRIAINAHYLGDAVEAHVARLAKRHPALSFHVSREETLLGTGGAVRRLHEAGWLRPEPFWVLNSDAVFEAPLGPLVAVGAPCLMVTAEPEHRHIGRLIVAPDGALVGLDESAPQGGLAFCGVTLADADLPSRLPPGESCILRQGLLPFLASLKVRTVAAPGFYADTGTPALLVDAHLRGVGFAARALGSGRL